MVYKVNGVGQEPAALQRDMDGKCMGCAFALEESWCCVADE